MTYEQFVHDVECRALIDYDGFGVLAGIDYQTDQVITPDDVWFGHAPDKGEHTHVMWFNR